MTIITLEDVAAESAKEESEVSDVESEKESDDEEEEAKSEEEKEEEGVEEEINENDEVRVGKREKYSNKGRCPLSCEARQRFNGFCLKKKLRHKKVSH